MHRTVLTLLFLLFSIAAQAADQPVYAPAADWVTHEVLPKTILADTTTPTRILLQNMQVRFTEDARETFVETIYKIQTPQGLPAGNLALSWKPDTDSLTIHTLKIMRGDQTIDLLSASHAFTVLRRENNLEMSMLDGALTAAIQPEGLQVGDILDVAFTLRKSDPVMQGHAEALVGNLASTYADKSSVRQIWQKSKKMRWRQTEGLGPAKTISTKFGEELTIEMNNVQPIRGPKGAPPRFFELGELEGTEFQSWADVSALTAPLYEKASTIGSDSPLKAEAAKIKAASDDPKQRAMAALKLVEDQIRYLFLGMNNGGYIPAGADETWARRFGDCKGKTAILLALLHELGIEAEPALASILHGDGLNERLPTLEIFDHVLVRATVGGKVYWLDGTRVGDRNLEDLPLPGFHWLLPVQPSGAVLTQIDVLAPDKPLLSVDLLLDASAGLDAPATAHATATFRGDSAIVANLQMLRASKADLEKYLKDYWRGQYDWIDIAKVDAAYDTATGEELLSMDGSGKMEWKTYSERPERQYQANGAALGWKAEFDRDSGPNDKAPFAVAYPYYVKYSESIRLPDHGDGFTVSGEDVDKVIAAREFKRATKIENGIFKMEASTKSIAAEFPFADSPIAKRDLRALFDEFVDAVAPKSLLLNNQEFSVDSDVNIFISNDFTSSGNKFLENREYDRAIGDLDEAIELSPRSAVALADRGVAYFWKGKYDQAQADLDRANEIDSKGVVVHHGYGLLAMMRFKYERAVEEFTNAINLMSMDAFSFEYRGLTYEYLNKYQEALSDYARAIEIEPNLTNAYRRRAELLVWLKKPTEALSDAERLIALAPTETYGHFLKANALYQLNKKEEAEAEFEISLKNKPTVEAYLARAQLHSDSPDIALADVNLALALEPKSPQSMTMRAKLYGAKGEYARAVLDANEAVALAPNNLDIRAERASLLAKNHNEELALKDYDFIVSQTPGNPNSLNNRCWCRAQLGKNLDAALVDCDASLKIREKPSFRDSRGFVYLRLGRIDDAISDYDKALALSPNLAPSLFGRGIAKLRKGDAEGGQADLAAAHVANPKIEEQFAEYGVKP